MKMLNRRVFFFSSLTAVTVGAIVLMLPETNRTICGALEDDYQRLAEGRVGKACIDCNPELTQAYVAQNWAVVANEGIDKAIREDFANGRTSHVEGWVLARSEILKYAAIYYGLMSAA